MQQSQAKYTHAPQLLSPYRFTEFCLHALGVPPATVRSDIKRWLDEDAGHGDISVMATSSFYGDTAEFFVVAKEDFLLAGLPLMQEIFVQACDSWVELYGVESDGIFVKKGTTIISGKGIIGGLLLAERTALNIASRLSGIATKTQKILHALTAHRVPEKNPPTLLETRKTTPGLRLYEKYATRVGGARNHRHGLDAGAMLKENHLRMIGYSSESMRKVCEKLPVLSKLEVEVTSLDELREALAAKVDVVMLDNFTPDHIETAITLRNELSPNTKLELSGNLDRQDLAWLACCGVDYISMGALIHQATWVDMSMQVYKPEG